MPRSTKDLLEQRVRQIELAIQQAERRSWTRPLVPAAVRNFGSGSLALMGGLGPELGHKVAVDHGRILGLRRRGRRR